MAVPLAGVGVPLVQVTLTLTEAPLFGTKSFTTVKLALFSVLTIVQLAAPPITDRNAGAVRLVGGVTRRYRDSVVVQVAPTVKPVIVVENGVASDRRAAGRRGCAAGAGDADG